MRNYDAIQNINLTDCSLFISALNFILFFNSKNKGLKISARTEEDKTIYVEVRPRKYFFLSKKITFLI